MTSVGSSCLILRVSTLGGGTAPKLLFAGFIFHSPVKFGLPAGWPDVSRATLSSDNSRVFGIRSNRRKRRGNVPPLLS